jgi:hypothetical protein
MKCSSVSAKGRDFVHLDVVKVTVRVASWITIRTCITIAFAGHGNLQYYSIDMFWCYIMCSCVSSISARLNSGYWRLLPSGGCLWNSNVECVICQCRISSLANWRRSFERCVWHFEFARWTRLLVLGVVLGSLAYPRAGGWQGWSQSEI